MPTITSTPPSAGTESGGPSLRDLSPENAGIRYDDERIRTEIDRMETQFNNDNFDQETAADLLIETRVAESQANEIAKLVGEVEKAVASGDQGDILSKYESFENTIEGLITESKISEADRNSVYDLLEATLQDGGSDKLVDVYHEAINSEEQKPSQKALEKKQSEESKEVEIPEGVEQGHLLKEDFDLKIARAQLDANGVDKEKTPGYVDVIEALGSGLESRSLNEIESELQRYFNLLSEAKEGSRDKAFVDDMLGIRLGTEGMVNLYTHIDKVEGDDASIEWRDLDTYKAMISAANKANEAGDNAYENYIKGLVENFDNVAEANGWDEEKIALQKKLLNGLVESKSDVFDQGFEGGSGEAEETEKEPTKKRIRDRIKGRFTALGLALHNPMEKEHWKDIFGNEKGEKSKRNAAIVGIGIVAAGTIAWLSYKGIDASSGVEVVPEVPGGDAAPDTGTGGEIPSGSEAYVDNIETGDGVTFTAQDLAADRYGLDLDADQMSDYWDHMNANYSSQEISDMFPGSSIGGEWGVTYGSIGQGGMTSEGVTAFEEWAKSRALM